MRLSAAPRDPRLNRAAGCPLLLTGRSGSTPRAGGQDAELKQVMCPESRVVLHREPTHPPPLLPSPPCTGLRGYAGCCRPGATPYQAWTPPLPLMCARTCRQTGQLYCIPRPLWLQAAASAKALRLQNITIMVPGPLLPPAWPDLPAYILFSVNVHIGL